MYMMTSKEFLPFLDNRNLELWNRLNSRYKILLALSPDKTYSSFVKGETATIFVPLDDYCADSFTHELLHIYLHSKEVFIGAHIKLIVRSNHILSQIINEDLGDHISNCLEHEKMFPIYLQLGYDKKKLISDFYLPKCNPDEIKLFGPNLRPGSSIRNALTNVYIGRFFAVKACPNRSFDYSSCIVAFKQADHRLFKILEEFWDAWVRYDIENMDAIHNSYYLICDALTTCLEDWADSRTVN
jgi:hypothetical protein